MLCQEPTAIDMPETHGDALERKEGAKIKEGAEALVFAKAKALTAGFQWIDAEISCETMKFLPSSQVTWSFLYFFLLFE